MTTQATPSNTALGRRSLPSAFFAPLHAPLQTIGLSGAPPPEETDPLLEPVALRSKTEVPESLPDGLPVGLPGRSTDELPDEATTGPGAYPSNSATALARNSFSDLAPSSAPDPVAIRNAISRLAREAQTHWSTESEDGMPEEEVTLSRAGSGGLECGNIESGDTETGKTGSGNTESVTTRSGNTGSGKTGSGEAVSAGARCYEALPAEPASIGLAPVETAAAETGTLAFAEVARRVWSAGFKPLVQPPAPLGVSGSERMAIKRLSSERLSSERLSSERLSSERLSGERLGSEQLGSERLGREGYIEQPGGEQDAGRPGSPEPTGFGTQPAYPGTSLLSWQKPVVAPSSASSSAPTAVPSAVPSAAPVVARVAQPAGMLTAERAERPFAGRGETGFAAEAGDPHGEAHALAHDAANLLSALRLYSDLLCFSGVLHERHRHYADDLKLLSLRSEKLIDRLVRLAENVAAANGSPDQTPNLIPDRASNQRADPGSNLLPVGNSSRGSRLDEAFPAQALSESTTSDLSAPLIPPAWNAEAPAAEPKSQTEPQPQPEPGSLAAVLLRLRGILGTIANGALELDLGSESRRPIAAPVEAIERVLINLVSNAAAATRGGGAIRIRAGFAAPGPGAGTEQEPVVIMSVDDSGCGMTEAQVRAALGLGDLGAEVASDGGPDSPPARTPTRTSLANLRQPAGQAQAPAAPSAFEPSGPSSRSRFGSFDPVFGSFDRGSASFDPGSASSDSGGGVSDRRGGSPAHGLGLTIVRDLVRAHGGRFLLDSRIGVGTRVEVQWRTEAAAQQQTGLTAVPWPQNRVPPGGVALADGPARPGLIRSGTGQSGSPQRQAAGLHAVRQGAGQIAGQAAGQAAQQAGQYPTGSGSRAEGAVA